jgi:hypothetical protein
LSPVSAAVGPEVTNPALVEVAVAVLKASIAAAPEALDSPAYSSAAPPMSALPVAFTKIEGLVPSPAVMGALHTLSSVSSVALTLVTLVYVLPAASVTPEIVAAPLLHTLAITTIRLPAVMLEAGVSCRVDPLGLRPDTRWTNRGAAFGVTALDAAESGPVPTEFVALTVNVYAVPLVSPVTTAVVGAGEPVTAVVACATPLTYGVTV